MNTKFAKTPRIIYNDDSCTLRLVPQPHTIDSIDHALDYLKGTQVDCLCWCLGEQIAYSWPSKVMENYYDMLDNGSPLIGEFSGERNAMLSLHRQGIDYLPILIDKAHEQGLTFIGSFRTNDTHIKSYPNSFLAPEFWKQNQQYRLWDATDGKGYYSAALDYSYPEVRNRYRDAIMEVANEYDIDGIELDFTRTPFIFQPSEAWDKREILTNFVREIRTCLTEIGERRERPFTFIIRFNCQEPSLRKGGIDVRQWIEQQLADIFVASEHCNNYNQDISAWRDLCRESGVLLYPAVESAPATNRTEYFSQLPRNLAIPRHDGAVPYSTAEIIRVQRAAAQNFLAQEPDGIYMFNFACSLVEGENLMHNDTARALQLASVLSEMGSLQTLENKDKFFPFYGELPIYIEASRPRNFHQTITFAIRGHDLKQAHATIRFRQIAERNPHAATNGCHSSFVEPGVIKYYLNGREIPGEELVRSKAAAGRIRSGFDLNEHEVIEIHLPGHELLAGENKLAFEMPHFPQETDPYVYIYELEVELNFGVVRH